MSLKTIAHALSHWPTLVHDVHVMQGISLTLARRRANERRAPANVYDASVLIPYIGTVVWPASWGAAIYLIIQRVRKGVGTGAVRRTGRR